MSKPLFILWTSFALFACGAELEQTQNSSSSSSSSSSNSSSSSSSSASSSGDLNESVGGACPVEMNAQGHLVVISAAEYQHRLQALLAIPEGNLYYTGIEQYAGRNLFEDEHSTQRMNLAVEAFYRNAQTIAQNHLAISCEQIAADECAVLFIAQFVEPLFQRTLTNEEHELYLQFFTQEDDPAVDGQRAAMIAAISSPNFLFRMEVSDEE